MPSDARSRLRSIAVQLPLSVSVILLAVVAVFSLAAYREVRRQAVEGTYVRLDVVSRNLANTIDEAFRRLAATAQTAADSEAVVAALATGSAEARARASTELESLSNLSPQILGVSLWDAAGRSMLEARRSEEDGGTAWAGSSPPSPSLTEPEVERVDGDSHRAWYDAVGVVRGPDRILGHLVVSWRVGGGSKGSRDLAELVGLDATFAIGRPGGKWTDLDGLTAEPVPASEGVGRAEYGETAAARKFAVGRQVDATPWQIWVAAPKAAALAGPRAFLARIAGGIGIAVLILGVLAAVLASRRVTRRLDRLTESADAIAEGRYNGQRLLEGEDELGRLARSFNVMARKVWESHRQLEKRVAERTLELENANRELEAFTYSASHDLRTPLRAILGFADIVSEECRDTLDERSKGYLTKIRRSAVRMQDLIDALLEFSRTNRHEIVVAEVDVTALAREVVGELESSTPGRRVDCRIAEGLVADADPRLLGVVLRNLIGNAWKFTAFQDAAVIEVGMQVGEDPTFFVRDNGAGFDMQQATRLFGPFQRLHSDREFQGTGIGLSLVERVVGRHGGRVWAEGAVGAGATFYFALPRVRRTAGVAARTA